MIFKMTSYFIDERNARADSASFHMHLFHTNNGLYIADYYFSDQVEASCEEMLSWLTTEQFEPQASSFSSAHTNVEESLI